MAQGDMAGDRAAAMRDMPADALDAAYALCAQQVRDGDPDRWTASLYWPAAARRHAHAVLAFNLAIAKVAESVSQPMAGEIRLQWWRDALSNGDPAGNPVAEALLDTIRLFNLDTVRLQAALEARSFDLYDDPMPSEQALETYLRDTASTMFEAIARILAPGHLPPAAADAAGRAYALTGLLRGLPWQVREGRLFLPLDLLDRFQLPPGEVLAHRNSPAARSLPQRVARGGAQPPRRDAGRAGGSGGGRLPAGLPVPVLPQEDGGPKPRSVPDADRTVAAAPAMVAVAREPASALTNPVSAAARVLWSRPTRKNKHRSMQHRGKSRIAPEWMASLLEASAFYNKRWKQWR